MNTTAHPASPPHDMHPYAHRGSIPNAHEAYRAAAPGAGAHQYAQNPHMPPSQGMPVPQQQQQQQQLTQGYGDPYNLAASRAPLDGQMQAADGLTPLAPGPGPAAASSDPPSRSVIEGGRKYELCVVQQPRRARMCGFGDKDRRPITPPPCVRLIITDINTGKECDCNEIDHGMFVLNVDLWSSDGVREVNLVRHSATSPSISATTPVSYGQVHETTTAAFSNILPGSNPGPQFKYEPGQAYQNTQAAYNPYPGPPQVNPYSQSQPPPQGYGGQQFQPGYGPNGAQAGAFPPQNGYPAAAGVTPVYYTTAQGIHAGAQSQPQQGIDYAPASQPLPQHSSLTSYGGRPFTPADVNIHRMPVSSTQPTGKELPPEIFRNEESVGLGGPKRAECNVERLAGLGRNPYRADSSEDEEVFVVESPQKRETTTAKLDGAVEGPEKPESSSVDSSVSIPEEVAPEAELGPAQERQHYWMDRRKQWDDARSNPAHQPGAGIQTKPIYFQGESGMFTRNLIGSLAASAFRLTDPDDRIGIWFVLQDLSVRTEGAFRLRFSFVNVSNPDYVAPGASSNNAHSSQSNGNGSPTVRGPKGNDVSKIVNTTKSQVLASCYSEIFTVYSAKKFPGVVESTPLSKCFATQGIKIPIRKDGPGKGDGKGREEYDED